MDFRQNMNMIKYENSDKVFKKSLIEKYNFEIKFIK